MHADTRVFFVDKHLLRSRHGNCRCINFFSEEKRLELKIAIKMVCDKTFLLHARVRRIDEIG